MADADGTRQRLHDFLGGEIVAHIAKAARGLKACLRIIGDDSARLLAAVLERVQPEGYEIRRIQNTYDPEDTTFLAQLVVAARVAQMGGIERMRRGMSLGGNWDKGCAPDACNIWGVV